MRGTTRQGRRIAATAAAAALAAAVCAAPAQAATQVGQELLPSNGCTPGASGTLLQTASPGNLYAMPSAGVVTRWSFRAANGPPASLRLKVARAAGGDAYTIVGESEAQASFTQNASNSFEARIPVRAGDLLGLFVIIGAGGDCPQLNGAPPGFNAALAPGQDVPPGTTATFFAGGPPPQLDIAATLEPDGDNDGYGDESQDCAPADASKNTDCTDPTATITKQPKDKVKTKKKKKKVTFEFSASEPGSTFNCVLDGKQEFKACTSPLTVSVKKGEHTFSVTATDAAGNQGAAASDTFKIKRNRKRKNQPR